MLIRVTALFLSLWGAAFLPAQVNPTYRFSTNVGNMDVVLYQYSTPINTAPPIQTVTNFLNYVNAGSYNNSIIHRLVNGFVAQGGGYQLSSSGTLTPITQGAAIPNEFTGVTNGIGTIAMALTSNSSGVVNPASATSEWFFNLANNGVNGENLDGQMFTVFGAITSAASNTTTLNKINALGTSDFSESTGYSDLTNVPLTGNGQFLVVSSIVPVPSFTSNSVTSAASYAPSDTNGISPGEILTIFGSGLGPSTLTTLSVGSNGVVANSLGGTQVFFNGTAAPIVYTSAGQVSVVAPYEISSLPTVSMTISYNGTEPVSTTSFPVRAANPAIFTQNQSGTGDGVIVKYNSSGYTVIGPSNPASVGDVLTLFGEGYGAATTSTSLPDGTIVTTKLPVPNAAYAVLIDGQTLSSSNIGYFGGAPDLIEGALQVNFTVPQLNPGTHQIQLQIGSGATVRTSPTGVTFETK